MSRLKGLFLSVALLALAALVGAPSAAYAGDNLIIVDCHAEETIKVFEVTLFDVPTSVTLDAATTAACAVDDLCVDCLSARATDRASGGFEIKEAVSGSLEGIIYTLEDKGRRGRRR